MIQFLEFIKSKVKTKEFMLVMNCTIIKLVSEGQLPRKNIAEIVGIKEQ